MSLLSSWWSDITGGDDAAAAADAAARQQQQQFRAQQDIAADQQRRLQEQLDAQRGDEDRRAREAALLDQRKKDAISGGNQSIDQVFAQFDEPYFQRYAKTYTDAQTPELQRQYGITKDKLTANLAGKGILDSSVAANKFAELDRTNRNALSSISGEAQDAANTLRNKVSTGKSQLYSDVLGGADPNQIASRSATDATSLANIGAIPAPPNQSISDLFGSLVGPTATAATAAINSPIRRTSSLTAPLTGAGSSYNG